MDQEVKVLNTSGLEPRGRAVLVKPYESEEKTAGGIIIPLTSREKDELAEQRAVVIAIGPEAWRGEVTPRAAIGEHVMYARHSGYVAIGPADKLKYRVVNDNDIFMAITAEAQNG